MIKKPEKQQSDNPPHSTLSRRNFLKVGLIGGALLSAAGAAINLTADVSDTEPDSDFVFLKSTDISFITALIVAIIDPAIPGNEPDRSHAIQNGLQEFDQHAVSLSAEAQKLLRQVLDTATQPVTKGITTGVWESWDTVSQETTRQFLDRWQNSSMQLFRMSHSALIQLISITWYGNPQSFAFNGYPGAPHTQLLVSQPNKY